jgi:ankyrin repeat protein
MANYDDLMRAVSEGDPEKVKKLLEVNRAIAKRPPVAGSVVLAAIYRGRMDLVEMLRPHIELDVFDAAALGETGRVKELVDRQADLVRGLTIDGWTPLHLAAFMGHRETAEALLEMGADVTAVSKNEIANQPLHAALAGKADRGLVEMLIERGAEVNGRGGSGVRPLHLAAARGDAGLCDMLVSGGADVRAKMDDGMTAAEMARKRGHERVAELLTRYAR